jgi:drug/metabolite transporter (DMT)-like permease
MGVTNVLLRHMKMLHEYTSATYTVMTAVLLYGLQILLSGESLQIISTIDTLDCIILVSVSVFGGFAMVCKAKAMQYEMASRLSILNYLSVILILIFDLLLIGTVFNGQEVIGISIVFLSNGISAYSIYKIHNAKNPSIKSMK